jgi:hypothetical protein
LADTHGPVVRKVVIDHDILGWGAQHMQELVREYSDVIQVSKHPDLPRRDSDSSIAAYCRANGCDLLTGDAKSYTHFFEVGVEAVKVRRRDWWEHGDRPVYLVQIEE